MDLTKMFVLVPSTSAATVADIKTKSSSDNKIYFMAKFNQIVAKGVAYGIDPVTAKEISTTITALGGTAGDDGTVTVDFSGTNYASTVSNAVDAIKALDTKIKTEMDKIAASKTLNDSYEVTARVKYHAGTSSVGAYISFEDEENNVLGNKIEISDIIGNGVLDHSTYDEKTGILTLYFKTSKEGVFDKVEINLAELLDISDITIDADSTNYLKVTITTTYHLISDPSQTITKAEYDALSAEEKALYTAERGFSLGSKMVKIADATSSYTGLVDAKDAKDYIASQTTSLTVEAAGDEYVSAYVDAGNNKKVWVAADVQDITYSAGTRGTWTVTDAGVATLSGETNPSISGVAQSLVDGAQAAEAIKVYSDAKVAQEAAERAAKIDAAIKSLDVAEGSISGKASSTNNVHFTYSETDGKIALKDIYEDYAEVTRTASTSTQAAPKTDGAIAVKSGDESKLVKASDLAAAAAYAADKAKEADNAVQYRIDNLAGDVTSDDASVANVEVKTSKGEVSDVIVTTISAGVNRTGDVKDARVIAATTATGALVGSDITYIKGYVDDKVADATTDLAVTAEGDSYVGATVSTTDNKHVIVSANPGALTVTTTAGVDSTIAGDANKFIAGAEIAAKVASYVNARIEEEIKKLDVTSYDLSNGNVHLSYEETDGIVKISGLSLDYTTLGTNKEGTADTTITLTDGGKLATGNDVKTAADFANTRIAEEIDKLDVTTYTLHTLADGTEGDIHFAYSETNGIVKVESLGAVYSEYTTYTKGAGTLTTGIVTGTELQSVLGDVWEEYQG